MLPTGQTPILPLLPRGGEHNHMSMSPSTASRKLLIVWHSRSGAARQLAHEACRGARDAIGELEAQERLGTIMLAAADATVDDVLAADAYLFCAPENLGSLSGAMKEFFDRSYYGVLDRIAGRPYALLISAGSDGEGAVRQAQRICTGWRLREAAPAYIAHMHAQTPEEILAEKTLDDAQIEHARLTGGTLAALLA